MKNLFTLALLTLITLTSCSKEETPDTIECYEIVEIKNIVVRVTDREAEYFVQLKFSNGIKWVEPQDRWQTLYNGHRVGEQWCDSSSNWEKARNN
jgi:hypothetical protein